MKKSSQTVFPCNRKSLHNPRQGGALIQATTIHTFCGGSFSPRPNFSRVAAPLRHQTCRKQFFSLPQSIFYCDCSALRARNVNIRLNLAETIEFIVNQYLKGERERVWDKVQLRFAREWERKRGNWLSFVTFREAAKDTVNIYSMINHSPEQEEDILRQSEHLLHSSTPLPLFLPQSIKKRKAFCAPLPLQHRTCERRSIKFNVQSHDISCAHRTCFSLQIGRFFTRFFARLEFGSFFLCPQQDPSKRVCLIHYLMAR